MGYTQISWYPDITPEIAASGVDEALKVLEGRQTAVVAHTLWTSAAPSMTYRLYALEWSLTGPSHVR